MVRKIEAWQCEECFELYESEEEAKEYEKEKEEGKLIPHKKVLRMLKMDDLRYNNNGTYICKYCGLKFRLKNSLIAHLRKCHLHPRNLGK